MADPTTPNLNLVLPAVGADQDSWGGLTNNNWQLVDSLLGSTPPLPAAATGNVGSSKTWARADHVHPTTGGATDAPSNGTSYGRMNANWVPVMPLAGGTISGSLSCSGALGAQGSLVVYGQASLASLTVSGASQSASPGNITCVYITCSNGFKPGGGVWADSSDARIKTVLGDYDHGLNAVLALHPVRYRLNGNYGPHANVSPEAEFVGLVAQDAETAMPEMVRRTSAVVDDRFVDDLRILDASSLTYALVNAVKELATSVAALQARLDAV
jgi:hypothetical protein